MLFRGQTVSITYVPSTHLSPAERNYDVGNWELLPMMLTLEEWRHWQEGLEVPFVVWTDHHNLKYIQLAK